MNTAQGQISYESLAEILEAFLAAYVIVRKPKKSRLDFVYLMTLPGDKQAEAKEANEVGSEDVRRVVTRTIQMLKNPTQKRRKPILAVRNLYRLLDEEQVPQYREAERCALAALAGPVAGVRARPLFRSPKAPAREGACGDRRRF